MITADITIIVTYCIQKWLWHHFRLSLFVLVKMNLHPNASPWQRFTAGMMMMYRGTSRIPCRGREPWMLTIAVARWGTKLRIHGAILDDKKLSLEERYVSSHCDPYSAWPNAPISSSGLLVYQSSSPSSKTNGWVRSKSRRSALVTYRRIHDFAVCYNLQQTFEKGKTRESPLSDHLTWMHV